MLSSVVVILVSTTFLVQNSYYAIQTERAGAQDNARVATELIAAELRSSMGDGIAVAGARTIAIRSPIALGVVCNRVGAGTADIHTEGGEATFDPAEVAGVGIRLATLGTWDYRYASWASVDGSDGLSAAACAANGADTTGAYSDFHRLVGLDSHFSPVPSVGDVVMLFRHTTFKIQPSELDTTSLGLFRAVLGDSLVEFATGIDSTAQFQYRTGGVSYADTIVAANAASVDAVRIVADARKRARTGGRDDITFGWAVNVLLRNVRWEGS